MGISASIITYNNERTIENTLKSLSWVSEIIIVDSFSTDNTPAICKKYTNTFSQRKWPGFKKQYEFSTSLAKNDWVFFVDADEVVSENLANEILNEISSDKYDGFLIYRHTFYLGRWIEHGGWNPDREIRVYRKSRGRWEGGLHATVKVNGNIKRLQNYIGHYNYKDVSDQIQTIDKYSTIAAKELLDAGRAPSVTQMIFRPFFRFLRDYFVKRGYKDGVPGLVVSICTSFYVFTKYAKLWELTHLTDKRKKLNEP